MPDFAAPIMIVDALNGAAVDDLENHRDCSVAFIGALSENGVAETNHSWRSDR